MDLLMIGCLVFVVGVGVLALWVVCGGYEVPPWQPPRHSNRIDDRVRWKR